VLPERIHVMTSRHERRKQYRHVVVGLQALLDGVPAPIIDISRTAVRLLKPQDFIPRECRYDIVFVVVGSPPRRPLAYRVSGELTRSTEIELVYHYAPPIRNWERMLRENDSFLQTALQPL